MVVQNRDHLCCEQIKIQEFVHVVNRSTACDISECFQVI